MHCDDQDTGDKFELRGFYRPKNSLAKMSIRTADFLPLRISHNSLPSPMGGITSEHVSDLRHSYARSRCLNEGFGAKIG